MSHVCLHPMISIQSSLLATRPPAGTSKSSKSLHDAAESDEPLPDCHRCAALQLEGARHGRKTDGASAVARSLWTNGKQPTGRDHGVTTCGEKARWREIGAASARRQRGLQPRARRPAARRRRGSAPASHGRSRSAARHPGNRAQPPRRGPVQFQPARILWFYSPASRRSALVLSRLRSSDSRSAMVVAGQRNGADIVGELKLKDDEIAETEAGLGAGEVIFPHPAEALVVERRRLLPARHETVVPGFQRLCIMQPQNFDVGHDEAAAFDRGSDFRQSRNIAAGKDIFVGPRDRWCPGTPSARSYE